MSLMLLDRSAIIDENGAVRDGVASVLGGLRLRQAPFYLTAPVADDIVATLDLADDEYAAEALTSPRAFLALLAEKDCHGPEAWLISATTAPLAAAATAGIGAAVLIYDCAPPNPAPALRIEHAADLADAPRVMVPKGGGCWHDL